MRYILTYSLEKWRF